MIRVAGADVDGGVVGGLASEFEQFFFPIRPTRIPMHPPIPRHDSLIETADQHITHTTPDVSLYSDPCNIRLLEQRDTYRRAMDNGDASFCDSIIVAVICEVSGFLVNVREGWPNCFVEFRHARVASSGMFIRQVSLIIALIIDPLTTASCSINTSRSQRHHNQQLEENLPLIVLYPEDVLLDLLSFPDLSSFSDDVVVNQ